MMFVDVERGRRDGIAMAKELEEVEALDTSERFARVDASPIHMVEEPEEYDERTPT